jgi:glucose/arabinose dehydrogenase
MRHLTGAALLICLAFVSQSALAVPAGFTRTRVASGLGRPTAMAFAPDGRLFITERGTGNGGVGRVRIFKDGALLAQPALSINTDINGPSPNERGVLGIAVDPDFASNGFIYVYYTVRSPAHNRISRFTVQGDTAGSELPLLNLENLNAGNHAGGPLLFGRDGKLYIGVGENAVPANSRNMNNHLGKILRINKDGSTPGDNPFFEDGGNAARNRLYAIGMRNPYSMAVHPSSGRIFVNDVGQSRFEEINDLVAGRNYGWTGGASDGDATAFFRYPASLGKCIAGGAFYAPATAPGNFASFANHYFYGDFTRGWVRAINVSSKAVTVFEEGLRGPIDVEAAADGNLYILTHTGGELFRVTSGTTTQPNSLVVSAAGVDVKEGTSETITVALASRPAGNVVVAVAKASGDRSISVSPASLTFTPGNFAAPQTVTVTAAQDPGDNATESGVITLAATGLATRRVAVNAIDDDVPFTVVITAPREGETVSGRGAEFFGGNDDEGTVKGEFFIDGQLEYTDNTRDGHFHFGGSHTQWDTTTLSDGPHTLRLVITGADGTSARHQINVVVRNGGAPLGEGDGIDGIDGVDGRGAPAAGTGCSGGDRNAAAGTVLMVGIAFGLGRRRRRG